MTADFTTGNITKNFLLGVKYTLSQVGTLNSINLIGNGTGERVQMAVYNDNSGVPNNLIASSGLGTVGSGITSFPVTPTLLPAGDYWIMAVYEVGGNSANANITASGNIVYYHALTYNSPIPTNASSFSSYSGHDLLYFLGIECGNTLSIEEFNLVDEISIFPNPTSGFLNISSDKEIQKIDIYSLLGRKVGSATNTQMDISNLASGVYLLKIETKDGKVATKRIVKQ